MIEGNNLLQALRPEDRDLIEPHLRPMVLDAGHVMYDPGDNVEQCYFPVGTAVASYLVPLESGTTIEVIMVGREGVLGGIVSKGRLPAFARSCTLHSGLFLRMPLAKLDEAKMKSRSVEHLFNRYADCLLAQIFQSVACNASHTIEQRAAKWLCAAVERTGSHDITMTQEQLASMMGVGRSYVTRIVKSFKHAGMVETRRGGIKVVNHDELLEIACQCNELVHDHFNRVLKGVYPA